MEMSDAPVRDVQNEVRPYRSFKAARQKPTSSKREREDKLHVTRPTRPLMHTWKCLRDRGMQWNLHGCVL